jgi:hypothetical protein
MVVLRLLAAALALPLTACAARAQPDACASSSACFVEGRCTQRSDGCVATSTIDCQGSWSCSTGGDCYLDRERGRCDDGMRRADRPMMIGGIVVTSLGGAALLGGALTSIATSIGCGLKDEDECVPILGIGIMSAGVGVALAVGLPMVVVGGRRLPRDRLLLRLTPGGAALGWSF